jgi:hypothetical protein
MQIGMLWYDDDPQRPLEAKIGRAADRYREKYGRLPDTCYVHAQAMPVQAPANDGAAPNAVQLTVPLSASAPPEARKGRAAVASVPARGTLRVLSAPYILLHHFWLGENTGS